MARPANASNNTDLNPDDDVDMTGLVNTENLYQVKGDGESHLKYFVQNRFKYCDSKWYAGDYPNDFILMRINTPQKAPLIPTNTEVTTIELDENQKLNLCVTGAILTDTYLAYTCGDTNGKVELDASYRQKAERRERAYRRLNQSRRNRRFGFFKKGKLVKIRNKSHNLWSTVNCKYRNG